MSRQEQIETNYSLSQLLATIDQDAEKETEETIYH